MPGSEPLGAPELLHDGREPYIKHDELVAVQFLDPAGKPLGILVQWNCHPETLGGQNTHLSADFVGATVAHVREKFGCPVAYFTGTVGGLMTSLHVDVKDDNGRPLADGTVEKTEHYGRLIGRLTERALAESRPIELTPLTVHSREIFVPLDNKLYLIGRQLGVLTRDAFVWAGDPYRAARPATRYSANGSASVRKSVGCSWETSRSLSFPARSIPSWCSTRCKTHPTREPISPMPQSSQPSTNRCPGPTAC